MIATVNFPVYMVSIYKRGDSQVAEAITFDNLDYARKFADESLKLNSKIESVVVSSIIEERRHAGITTYTPF
ncbi:hypothetical protein HC928_05055 [bacterium]|nr:hypothetical protein [bacterium]